MNAITHATAVPRAAAQAPAPDHDAIRALYRQTQLDFGAWSRGYNMHVGYFECGMNPLRREPMLERMNEVAIDALGLERHAHVRIVDLGCGAGATARAAARRHPWATGIGVTLVRESIALAMKLDREAGLSRHIAYALTDLANAWMASQTMDGALAIESFCYAPGSDKAAAAREAARLLRPGARLVVVDGFIAGDEPAGLFGRIYRRWCECWAVPQLARLDDFVRALEGAGFERVEVRDLFWRAAPSAAHIPWVAAWHTLREIWRGRGRISAWRRRHIEASWLSILLGLARGRFRYCLVTATRAA